MLTLASLSSCSILQSVPIRHSGTLRTPRRIFCPFIREGRTRSTGVNFTGVKETRASARRIPRDEITWRLYIDRPRGRSSIYLIMVNESPPRWCGYTGTIAAIWEAFRNAREQASYARRYGRYVEKEHSLIPIHSLRQAHARTAINSMNARPRLKFRSRDVR